MKQSTPLSRPSAGYISLALLVAQLVFADNTVAQTSVELLGTVQISPSFTSWSFKTPIAQDSFTVRSVTQFAIPATVSLALGTRWVFDASRAYQIGSVAVTDANGVDRTLTLKGGTDLKLRLVGRVKGDHVRLTVGVNAPTGATKLAGTDVDAIRIIGAPALRLPVASLGSGFGGTVGVVFATQAAGWGLAAGTSYELRGNYSPIEASIAGAALPTDLNPADAVHITLGADRIVRSGRVSILGSADVYGEDELTISRRGSAPVTGTYKLGPSLSALMAVDFGVRGFREFSLTVVDRYRSAFRGIDGASVAGSNGNFLDANVRAVSGVANHFGLMYGVDAHLDSGQEVDNSIATAAVTTVGALFGVSIPYRTNAIQPYVRAQFGSLDTGLASTSLAGFSAGVTLTAR
ncbi:MAG: hypothetical protein ABJB74_09880 [Gemmatimonas sp.]